MEWFKKQKFKAPKRLCQVSCICENCTRDWKKEIINILLLLYHITTKVVAWNNTNLLFYSFRSQKSIISLRELKWSCLQGCVPSGGSRVGSTSICLFHLLLVTLTPWVVVLFHLQSQGWCHSGLCFHSYISFFDSDLPASFL